MALYLLLTWICRWPSTQRFHPAPSSHRRICYSQDCWKPRQPDEFLCFMAEWHCSPNDQKWRQQRLANLITARRPWKSRRRNRYNLPYCNWLCCDSYTVKIRYGPLLLHGGWESKRSEVWWVDLVCCWICAIGLIPLFALFSFISHSSISGVHYY